MSRKLRVVLGLLVGFLAAGAAPAVACSFAPGDIVYLTLTDTPEPLLVTDVSSECIVEYRAYAAPGEPFDPYASSMLEDFLLRWEGEPPPFQQYGCSWGPGMSADYRDADGTWHPAVIAEGDKDCNYKVDVYDGPMANRVELGWTEIDRLRVAELAPPTPDQQQAARLCPPGGAIEDFSDGSEDSLFKRAIIADVSAREKEPVHMYFENIRTGQMVVVQDGSLFQRENRDAPIGGEVFPFRLTASVCKQSGERPETTRHVYDYNCFADKFGDFVCRQEAER